MDGYLIVIAVFGIAFLLTAIRNFLEHRRWKLEAQEQQKIDATKAIEKRRRAEAHRRALGQFRGIC
jgi:hypothetical protein